MLRLVVVAALLAVSSAYVLKETWTGTTFWDHWTFSTAADPTHGFVHYVDRATATSAGLIKNSGDQAFIYAETVATAASTGRKSVRLESNNKYNQGLFVIDLTHMPTGCGTWPAFWMCGPNWPSGGEIDIIEGVDKQSADLTTLHTSDGCDQSGESTATFTGHWGTGSANNPATNCYINAANQYSNQGCSIVAAEGTCGAALNNAGGGVFATVWNSSVIAMWEFKHGSIPSDLTGNVPNPNTWGKPYARFELGSKCLASHFSNMKIIINLTFCGDWDGTVFATDCPGLGACNTYVQNNGAAFGQAYWAINHINIFQ
jgi:hypothetical protein